MTFSISRDRANSSSDRWNDRAFESKAKWRRGSLFAILVTVALSVMTPQQLFAQAGLKESLDRLDKNQNGAIEYEEVTPLARPYLERIMKIHSRRFEYAFARPVRIDKIQEAARIYYAVSNGVSGRDVRPEGEPTLKSFGTDPDQPIVPEFGTGELRFPYVQADLDMANMIMGKYDFNGDGYIDRAEADNNRWTHRNPFADDLNKDDRMSRLELAQRYARRRLLNEDSDELGQRARRTGGEIRKPEEGERKNPSEWWRRGGTSHWLTAAMMGRFDRNRNGRLELQEAKQMGLPLVQVDLDRDGEVTRDELHALVNRMQEEAGDLTEGLPGWFYELDEDRDGQVAMNEFTDVWTIAKREEFDAYDGNGDGLLTAEEVLQSKLISGGSYRNEVAEVLPPHRTIISEIEIEDDFVIEDLTVQLSITHTSTGYLDAYLTGPEGQRIELFTEVGGSGDHFNQTLFSDKSPTPIAKGRAPFEGTFRPEAIDKKQPGLNAFRGKSVKGVWQLIIRGTRSERFGMLHSWALSAKPAEDLPALQASPVEAETARAENREDHAEQRPSPETTPSVKFSKESKAAASAVDQVLKGISNSFGGK